MSGEIEVLIITETETLVLEGSTDTVVIESAPQSEIIEIGVAGVQGIPGPEGPSGSFAQERETPTGAVNGANTTFTTSAPFAPGSTQLHLNGVLLSVPDDYAETSSTTVQFAEPPLAGDAVLIVYATEA